MWSLKATLIYQVYALDLFKYGITTDAMSIERGRREMIGRTVTSTFGGMASLSSGWTVAPNAAVADTASENDSSFSSYQIFPDSSAKLDPTLKQIAPSDLNQIFAMTNTNNDSNGGGALWLGEHHNSDIDHLLQADFVRSTHEQRMKKGGANGSSNMAVGLEMVQMQFQPALDAYIAKQISAQEMRSRVDWEKRWSWSFESYLPIFETCRELDIPLVALNVDSEDLGLVEIGGLPNLPKNKLRRYISDPAGFAQFASSPYYKTYVDYVISPSYDFHKAMGILKTTITGVQLEVDMSFSRFFSGRILWDECMANNAYQWTKANPGGLMVGLVGADHVKFVGGITGRYQRMASSASSSNTDQQQTAMSCISVILNPSLIDTKPPGSVNMMTNLASSELDTGRNGLSLQLRYLKKGVDVGSPETRKSENTGGVLPVADYFVISKS